MGTQLAPPQKGDGAHLPNFRPTSIVAKRLQWIKMILGMEVGLDPATLCWMGTQVPSLQKGTELPPIFCPFLLLPNRWMREYATLYGGRPQPWGLCVRWGLSPPTQKGRSPQFSAHVYCGQTAAWIKTPLGTEVGLGLRDILLDGDPAPLPLKGHSPEPPIFG